MYPELAAANVALHAITAENDGDASAGTVIDRLSARDPTKAVAPLPFKVHSDPEHKLLGILCQMKFWVSGLLFDVSYIQSMIHQNSM